LDRFTGMAVFVKVVEAASFTAAARHFGMSPAMVSKHIQTLEDRLGARLLNRTTRRVSATEVGQDYYERCLRILAELNDADRAASDLQAAPRGLLRVTAPVSFGMRQLAHAIADYLKSYPEVSVDLSLDDQYVDLLEKRFDLAIRLGRLADSSLIARKLCALGTIVCASPGYLEANGAPKAPRDLLAHNCLVYTYAASQNIWNFVDQGGNADAIRVSGRFLASSSEALVSLARKDAGIILAPCYSVYQDLKAGRLVRLLPDFTTQETPVHAVYPHSRSLSAKTRTFIDFLATRFADSPQLKNGEVVAASNAHAPQNLRVVS